MKHRIHTYFLRTTIFIVAASALAIQGTWGVDIVHHWAFIIVMSAMAALACYQAITNDEKRWTGDALSHCGIALLLLAVMAGYPWTESGQAIVEVNNPVRLAYTQTGTPMALPFELQLKDFQITYYDDHENIRQFTSTLQVKGMTSKDTTTQILQTSVNHPARYQGYYLYQDSYDQQNQNYCVIKVVKSPLLPIIYIAMLILAIGAVLQIRDHWIDQQQWVWIIAGALAAVFTILSIMRIQFGVLMPALRSWWFVPHLACYMIAYAMLAIAIALSVVGFKPSDLSANLLHTASSLLLLGMICGAVWAQQAWGDYWAWDPKECWAAATWLLSLAATHTHRVNRERKIFRIFLMILCFIAMQVTWYGVNHLPSAGDSMHTYNKK